jgi:hypothetical protein
LKQGAVFDYQADGLNWSDFNDLWIAHEINAESSSGPATLYQRKANA